MLGNSFDKNLTPLINWYNLQFFKGFLFIKSMEKKWFVVYTRPQQELKVASSSLLWELQTTAQR